MKSTLKHFFFFLSILLIFSSKAYATSSDANFSNLTTNVGALTFSQATQNYTVYVPATTQMVAIGTALSNAGATIEAPGKSSNSGATYYFRTIGASSTYNITVTAQDLTTKKIYTVSFVKIGLNGLTFSGGVTPSGFQGVNAANYVPASATTPSSSVAYSVSSITLTPTVALGSPTVTVNGTTVTSGSASGAIALNVGSNTITTVVTAQDGSASTTYTTTLTRAGPSGTATLSNLAISSGTLSPSFASGTSSYTASVANSVSSITVTPTVSDSNSTVKVNGTTVTSGSASGAIALNVGSNTITTVVTAQDGTTTQTYTTTVTRASGRVSINDAVDGTVTGTVLAQASASQRFSEVQIRNVSDHIQSLKSGFNVKSNQIALGLNTPTLDPLKQVAQQFGLAFKQQNAVKIARNDLDQTGYIKLSQADTLPSDISVTSRDDQTANLNERLFGNKNIGIWASGSLDYGSINSNDFRTSGLTAGIDYQLNSRAIIGAAIGYGFDRTQIDDLGSRVKSQQTTTSLYGLYKTDSNWFLDGLVGYGDLSFNNSRYSTGASTVFSSNRNGDTLFGSISVAKFLRAQKFNLQPYARITQMSSTLDAYSEGTNANALAYDKATIVSRAVSLGFTAAYDIVLEHGTLTPNAKFELRHNSRGSINQTIAYADTPAESMTYSSTPAPDGVQSLGLGLSYFGKNGISGDVSWFGSIGTNSYHSNALKLNVRLPF